ncbi:conserved hypothetical protein [Ricinus communis]|uniref:Uncharacterized protein n=1 Tax=Ricinus communis TaxID=3988 RepID=B9RSC3_RICCO|nr:conserved hypothetical protein [Ricinus communis]
MTINCLEHSFVIGEEYDTPLLAQPATHQAFLQHAEPFTAHHGLAGRMDTDDHSLSDAEVDQYARSFIAYLLGSTILADIEQVRLGLPCCTRDYTRAVELGRPYVALLSCFCIPSPFSTDGSIHAPRVAPCISWTLIAEVDTFPQGQLADWAALGGGDTLATALSLDEH